MIIIVPALGGGGDETAGGGGGGGGQQVADSGQEEQAQKEEKEAQGQQAEQDQGQGDEGQQGQGQNKPSPASIGETVVVGDAAYTVTNARKETRLEDPSGFDEPMEGNFVVVDFTVENRGNDPMSVSDIGLYIYDDQGRQYETETDIPFGYIPEHKDLFLMDRINPGLSQDVRVVFSVPPHAQGFEMEVSSGLFATETRRIALGI